MNEQCRAVQVSLLVSHVFSVVRVRDCDRYNLNTQLSGKGMLQITVVVFGSLFLPLILSFMGMVSSKHSIWEQCAVLVVLLAVVSCTLAFTYDCIGRGKPLAIFYGGGGSGVVSA